MKIGTYVQAMLRFSQKFERLQCWYYCWEKIMMYAIEMISCGMKQLTVLMKIGTGVQARFCLRNLGGCTVGITEWSDL
jgi:hypothetical protein